MQADFEELVWFLKKLEIFKEAEIHVPQGLYIIKSGICKVGSEQIILRNKKRLPFERLIGDDDPEMKKNRRALTLKGNFKDQTIREK